MQREKKQATTEGINRGISIILLSFSNFNFGNPKIEFEPAGAIKLPVRAHPVHTKMVKWYSSTCCILES